MSDYNPAPPLDFPPCHECEQLRALLEDVKGNVYLWRIAEISRETAFEAICEVVERSQETGQP